MENPTLLVKKKQETLPVCVLLCHYHRHTHTYTHTLVCSVIKTSNERSYRILSVIPWTSGPKEETGVRAHARGGLKMQQCPLWFTLTATLSMSLMHSSRQEQPNLFFCPLSHSGGKKDVIVTTDKCLKHLNGASSGQRNIQSP